MLPSPSRPRTAQPVNPHGHTALLQLGGGGGLRGDIKNGRKGESLRKNESSRNELWSKDRKQFRVVRTGKAAELQIERPPPLIWTLFITSVGRHSHIAFHLLPHLGLQEKAISSRPMFKLLHSSCINCTFETHRSEDIHHQARSALSRSCRNTRKKRTHLINASLLTAPQGRCRSRVEQQRCPIFPT